MDGQLAQAPDDLQAHRYRATLVTHEPAGWRTQRLPQEPRGLPLQCLQRVVAEELYGAQVLAAEVAGSEGRGQVTGVGPVKLVGEKRLNVAARCAVRSRMVHGGHRVATPWMAGSAAEAR